MAINEQHNFTKRGAKYLLALASIWILVAAGAVLPGMYASGRDRLILGQVVSSPLDEAEQSDYMNISMVDKVSLLGQTAGTSLVPLKTGAIYDQNTIRTKFTEELGKLHALSYFPLSALEEMSRFRPLATLYIQNDAPAINSIIWEINMSMEEIRGVFYMDDQTGKILSFTFSGAGSPAYTYEDASARNWAGYLGADIRNIKKKEQTQAPEQDSVLASFSFELVSGSHSVLGQISSETHTNPEQISQWNLQYQQADSSGFTLR